MVSVSGANPSCGIHPCQDSAAGIPFTEQVAINGPDVGRMDKPTKAAISDAFLGFSLMIPGMAAAADTCPADFWS